MRTLSMRALAPLLILFSSLNAWAGVAPTVRVRIIDGAPTIPVRGFDLRLRSLDSHDLKLAQSSALRSEPNRLIAARADRVSEWKFSCPNGGVVEAAQIGTGKFPLRKIFFTGPLTIESPSGFITVKGKPYREKVTIHPISNPHGWDCEAVNHVDIESYLDGLVNAEFSAAWNREAIDAQVIAARTYAYYQIKLMSTRKSHFDLDSTIKDQVYDGSMKEDYRSRMSATRTRGTILKASLRDPWPIKAYYHSTCGGTTELPQVVWGAPSKGFKSRVQCPYCKTSPSYVWDVPLASKEVALAVWKGARDLKGLEREQIRAWPQTWEVELRESQLTNLRVTSQNASGRAEVVTSTWKNPKGKEYTLAMSGTTFRSWIGPARLKSTVFQVLAAGGDQWVLRGRGFGHGVGLCQWGAKVAGESGVKTRAILKTYYPDAVLARAW